MKQRSSKGFSLLEVLLAVVVITIAGLGAYSLFDSGIKSNNISDAEDQVVQIANVYTDLASSNLTSADNDVPTLLQNSGRLSSKYFSSSVEDTTTTVSMNNAFGALTFASATPYSFTVVIPLGCLKGDVTSSASVSGQFFSKVKDAYSCDINGSKDYSNCTVTACDGETRSTITLFFNMNH